LISEDASSCPWFEDNATIHRGWNGFQPDREKPLRKRKGLATIRRVWE
jgi:hypothetical protein